MASQVDTAQKYGFRVKRQHHLLLTEIYTVRRRLTCSTSALQQTEHAVHMPNT
jgi:hypothetical protein